MQNDFMAYLTYTYNAVRGYISGNPGDVIRCFTLFCMIMASPLSPFLQFCWKTSSALLMDGCSDKFVLERPFLVCSSFDLSVVV